MVVDQEASVTLEQMLHQAIQHHQAQRFAEAEGLYRQILRRNPDYAPANHNLGVLAAQSGQLTTAIPLLHKALQADAAQGQYWLSLSDILLRAGQAGQALGILQQGMARGVAGEAVQALLARVQAAQAVAAKPGDGPELARLTQSWQENRQQVALTRALVHHYIRHQRWTEAMAVAVRGLQANETPETRELFLQCVTRVQFMGDIPLVRTLLGKALDQCWCRPGVIVEVCIVLIKLNRGVMEPAGPILQAMAGDALLGQLLLATTLPDLELEKLLTRARSALLALAMACPPDSTALLPFACALASQCFINEYLYDCDEDELEQARGVRERLDAALAANAPVPPLWPVAVACYFPLHTLAASWSLLQRPWPPELAALLTLQVAEPLEELAWRQKIPRLTAIEDPVSRLVQQQYETHPYPRWRNLPLPGKSVALGDYFHATFPHGAPWTFAPEAAVDILVAGCGTGQQSIETASLLAHCRVLAVDLSLASLGYAARKSQSLSLGNIQYAQADILQLAALERRFHLIEASGVLHHLADPWAGWRALLGLLRPGGLMFVALYSELGRAPVVAARRLIAGQGLGSSAAEIRRCRRQMVALGPESPYHGVTRFSDFYSTSMCRDLLFHVQEHRLTLPAIQGFIQDHGLEFVGFLMEPEVQQRYRSRFPEDETASDLERWHRFEQQHPETFRGMYQLVVQKKAPIPTDSDGETR